MGRGFGDTGRPRRGLSGRGGPGPPVAAAGAGTAGARRDLPPGGSAEVVFLLGWHFPNRRAWVGGTQGPRGEAGEETVGNHYATRSADAWAVRSKQAPRLAGL